MIALVALVLGAAIWSDPPLESEELLASHRADDESAVGRQVRPVQRPNEVPERD